MEILWRKEYIYKSVFENLEIYQNFQVMYLKWQKFTELIVSCGIGYNGSPQKWYEKNRKSDCLLLRRSG